jgi:hypothetical protein
MSAVVLRIHEAEVSLSISVSLSAICHLYLYNDIMIHYMPYITVYIYHYTYITKICRSPRLDRTRFDVGLGVWDRDSHFAWGISAAAHAVTGVIKGSFVQWRGAGE